MVVLVGYVLGTKEKSFFVNPSSDSWGLDKSVHKATIFKELSDAVKVCEAVDRAVCTTYWSWDDIVPHPYVYEFYNDSTIKMLSKETHIKLWESLRG